MRSRLGTTLKWLGVSVNFLSWLDLMFGHDPTRVRRDITLFGLGIVIGFTGEFILRRNMARPLPLAVLVVVVAVWTALVLSHLPS